MKFLWFLILILFLPVLCAQEVGGLIKAQKELDVQFGDIVNLEINLWPSEAWAELSGSSFESKFIDKFYVSKVLSLAPSENNQNVLVVEVLAVYTPPQLHNPFVMNEQQVKFKYQNINLLKKETKLRPEMLIFKQQYSESGFSVKFWLGLFILIVLLGSSLAFYYHLRKKKEKLKELKKKARIGLWRERILKARNREDFEKLYLNRNKWLSRFNLPPSKVKVFDEVMQQRCYIPQWTEEDIEIVQAAVEEIREGINRDGV